MRKDKTVGNSETINIITVPIGLSIANATINLYKEKMKSLMYYTTVELKVYSVKEKQLLKCTLDEQSNIYSALRIPNIASASIRFRKPSKLQGTYEYEHYLLKKDKLNKSID